MDKFIEQLKKLGWIETRHEQGYFTELVYVIDIHTVKCFVFYERKDGGLVGSISIRGVKCISQRLAEQIMDVVPFMCFYDFEDDSQERIGIYSFVKEQA